ncbi:unnamed protein product [Withania somnifera]
MSFPWKKLKKTSISQLAKDHVCSQRIGGSPLMVETGFPTSLVDLFAKNRQRFMKTSKKKRSFQMVVKSPSSHSLPLPSPLTPTLPDSYTIESSRLRGCQEKGERIDLDEAVDKNMVLIVLFKIFLVAVLVLGTKKLLLGITMSAFLLFFFEYSGERVYRLFMACAGAQRSRMVEIEEENDDDCVFKAPLTQENLVKLRCSDFAKIHVLKPPHEEEVQCLMEGTDESSRGSKLKCEGLEKKEELRSDLLDSKRKKSHKSEMKSKMKRFLAKKLRRKISKELESQITPVRENDVIIDELEDFNDCQKSSEEVLDATIIKVDSLTRKEQNSANIILLLVVLVGLIGGRTSALVFTLTWCMMSKQVLLKVVVRIFQLIPRKL